ncbi:hypothetical protein COLO4_36858 [Corchorus olitorius]|uniref:Uncharacterized protein n=1 Tax=Corchorus olitorius TaxID=93759 RepID=A0A1R3G4U5_9ROSI|nr:hypothetical protein COLO4_36858 [Corchorus olitorius]
MEGKSETLTQPSSSAGNLSGGGAAAASEPSSTSDGPQLLPKCSPLPPDYSAGTSFL